MCGFTSPEKTLSACCSKKKQRDPNSLHHHRMQGDTLGLNHSFLALLNILNLVMLSCLEVKSKREKLSERHLQHQQAGEEGRLFSAEGEEVARERTAATLDNILDNPSYGGYLHLN